MKITILNKREAKYYIPEGKAIILRMGDSIPYLKLRGEYLGVYEFYFSDVDKISDYAITDEEAIELVNIVKKNIPEIDEFVVHCEYGQGRSPAVGFAISEYLKLNGFDVPNVNYVYSYPSYNRYIFEKITSKF